MSPAFCRRAARSRSLGAGVGAVVRQHSFYDVEFFENDDAELVSASWQCQCGTAGIDLDNVGEAGAAARAHWRESIRAAHDATD
jgi:hypothetical protein